MSNDQNESNCRFCKFYAASAINLYAIYKVIKGLVTVSWPFLMTKFRVSADTRTFGPRLIRHRRPAHTCGCLHGHNKSAETPAHITAAVV